MCTAISYKTKNTYFGRNLDYEFSYGEKVCIVPRYYSFNFRHLGINDNHYAIIGMAHIDKDYPMFYDAMNECGLGMAGLNFVGNTFYNEVDENKDNVAQFEFIAYILATCKNVVEAKDRIEKINLVKTPYNEIYPTASLHFILKDKERCIVIESMKDGIHIYENKTGCLTNNPPFDYQLDNLKKYSNLSNENPIKFFSFDDCFYSRGMGGLGLPGDVSSQSRFVRACFTSYFSKSNDDEVSSVNQFFHILDSVSQTRGLCKIGEKYEITIYSSCMNLEEGIYYFKTYDDSVINAVKLKNENLDSRMLISYEHKESLFKYLN